MALHSGRHQVTTHAHCKAIVRGCDDNKIGEFSTSLAPPRFLGTTPSHGNIFHANPYRLTIGGSLYQ